MTQASETGRLKDKIGDPVDAVMTRVDRLFDTARPEAVYAEPVTAEGRTVIGAAEVLIAAGFGGGGGFGPITAAEGATSPAESEGVGAGMGGYAQSRPVAVVIIDGNGARVEPVVDVTKLGLAALTVFGSMIFMLGRMLRGGKGG